MYLTGGFDQVLKMCSKEEIPEVDEFTVVLVLYIDDTPLVLTPSDLSAIDNDSLLTANDGKGNNVLDRGIYSPLFIVQLAIVIRIHLEVVECELLLYSLLECSTFFEGQRVCLGDDWYNVDDI